MDVANLLPEIRREVRGCPDPTMKYALMRAAREFCNDTWLLRRTFTFNTVVGTQRYDVVAPDNEDVIAIKHAQIAYTTAPANAWPLMIVYPTTMNPNSGNGVPTGICLVPYTQVALDRPSDQVYAITVETISIPQVDGNALPDEIAVRYDRAIGYGALAWLMRQKGDSVKPNAWYDPQQALIYLQMFNQEIVKGRGEAAFDFSPGARNWMRNPFIQRRTGWSW